MKFKRRFKVAWGLCLAAICLLSVLAFGTGSASASGLLLLPLSHKFSPYHLVGLAVGEGKLESVGGNVLKSTAVHVLVLALNQTLFHLHILFLGVTGPLSSKCSNVAGNPEGVLAWLLGHLGLAHHTGGGIYHAVLLLIDENIVFTCEAFGVKEKVEVKGSVIGQLTKPAAGLEASELGIQFKQEKGKQLFTSFLLTGSELMTNMFLESKKGTGAFEQSGQEEPEVALKPLAGEGNFVLILDP